MKKDAAQAHVRKIIEEAIDDDEPALAMLALVEVTETGLRYSFGIASTSPIPFDVQRVVLAEFALALDRLQGEGAKMHVRDVECLHAKGGN